EGPANKTPLKADDVIKAVDKKPLTSLQQLTEALRNRRPGDKVPFTVVRDKQDKDVEVTLESRQVGANRPEVARPYSFMYGGQRPNSQKQQGAEGSQYGGVYKSTDGGETWTRVNSLNPRPMYFSQIRVDPLDDKYVYVLGISLYRSSDGGKKFNPDGSRGVH